MKMNRTSISLLFSLVLAAHVIIIADATEGQNEPLPKPEIHFEFDQYEFNCSVEPGVGDHRVVVTGSVWCKIPQTVPENVECIVVLLPRGDLTQIAGEDRMVFTRSTEVKTMAFEISIEEGYHKLEHYCTLEGYWHYENGMGGDDVNPIYCKINIERYGAADLSHPMSMSSKLEMTQGEYSERVIILQNNGNDDDWFDIEATCSLEGVKVNFQRERIGIQRGETDRLYLQIEVDDDVKGSGVINIKARSENPGVNQEDTVTLNIEVQERKNEGGGFTLLAIIGVLFFGTVLLVIAGFQARKRMKASDDIESQQSNGT